MMLCGCLCTTAQVYISPTGNDNNPGTASLPKATLHAALRQVREWRRLKDPALKNSVHIYLKGGVYKLSEPVIIRPEDSGTDNSPLYIEAVPNENPLVSGGISITSWKKMNMPVAGLPVIANGKVWVADVPLFNGQQPMFRQLWVNHVKATRAKSVNGTKMDRILNWNKTDQSCTIPIAQNNKLIATEGLEFLIHQWWEIALLRVKNIVSKGDSAIVYFHQPESRIQNEHPWPSPWLSKETGNSAFCFLNAIAFLDEPGEWFFDALTHKLYYWPRQGEDMINATVVAPYLETLVMIQGTADMPVRNIHFKNINFQHTGWLRPLLQGHVPHQAGMPMTEAYKLKPPGTKEKASLDNQAWVERPQAAVVANFAQSTSFEGCRFEHMASTGLDYHKGVQNNKIQGNLFKDIGGTAILAGVFSDRAMEIHLPYNPKDEREVCDAMLIANNLITDVANEDWGGVGIGLGYTRNSNILHNEISNIAYTGISMGWGWSASLNIMRNNIVKGNYIHHYGKHNYDCAGIYTLSAQPGSVIAENVIDSIYKAPYAHLPSHWFYLYTDEGSSGITLKNNWTPSTKYLQNNNGPYNVWQQNGPMVSNTTRQQAGITSQYQWLTTYRPGNLHTIPVNVQHEELIELVVPGGMQLDVDSLKKVLVKSNMNPANVYQWQNHYVVFDKVQDITVLQGRLQKAFPAITVRAYHDMYYKFDRSTCNDTTTVMEREHIILTANLVADEKKQQAYIQDHETQFEKWPEVAKGFCNAQFQQLLCFRNGRQLMLVISIPKGKTLSALDPKTTENNPRVVAWNKRMAQYQEGIAGTKPGETWVFLNQINSR